MLYYKAKTYKRYSSYLGVFIIAEHAQDLFKLINRLTPLRIINSNKTILFYIITKLL
jgi:hypothetical protein